MMNVPFYIAVLLLMAAVNSLPAAAAQWPCERHTNVAASTHAGNEPQICKERLSMPVNPVSINLANLNGTNGFRINSGGFTQYNGTSVSAAGDVNGDGFDDILIGAPGANNLTGESYIVYGKASGFGVSFEFNILSGVSTGDSSGFSVSDAGDVNGDGLDDILIGAFGANSSAGVTYLVYGKIGGLGASLNLSTLTGLNGFSIVGIAGGDRSGFSVSSAGDVNGDGFDDILIGAYGADALAGESYVVFGKAAGFGAQLNLSGLTLTDGFRIDGIDAADRSGRSVSAAGDFNGDGYGDIIIGADRAANEAGESYVIFGKATGFANISLASLASTDGFRLNGIVNFDGSGHSVSCAGDINGDGFDDIIIGAYLADLFSGESYVVFGKASGFGSSLDLSSLNGTNGFRIDGIDADDRSGQSVSAAGDVNGDGLDDILIGALDADGLAGESYVVFGRASGFGSSLSLSTLNGTNGFRIDGIDPSDRSGTSVSSAGDVNGDGFDDILIGAPGASSFAGETYVVFGRATSALNRLGTNAGEGLSGGDWDDVLTSLDGNDRIFALAGDDVVNAGGDNDTVDGGAGDDIIHGGSGNDTLAGGVDTDVIHGGSGNDNINGGADGDTLYGGSGNDTINGGVDAIVDLLFGNSGNDTYVLGASTNDVITDTGGIDTVTSTISRTLINTMENLTLLGTAAINGTGNGLANVITGNAAANTLSGGIGKDVLAGGKGRDTLVGGTQSDSFRFVAGDSGQTALSMDKITDYAKGAVGTVGDEFDFSAVMTRGGSALAATATQASINAVTGVATFAAGSGLTMADALLDITGRFTAAINTAGEFAFFKVNGVGPMHLFISDGVAGVGANDVLVQLSNVTTIGSINLTAGDLTILT